MLAKSIIPELRPVQSYHKEYSFAIRRGSNASPTNFTKEGTASASIRIRADIVPASEKRNESYKDIILVVSRLCDWKYSMHKPPPAKQTQAILLLTANLNLAPILARVELEFMTALN